MRNTKLVCPHCGETSIEVKALRKSIWYKRCKCPVCMQPCKSHKFVSLLELLLLGPLEAVFFIGALYFGLGAAIAIAIAVYFLGTKILRQLEIKFGPIRA